MLSGDIAKYQIQDRIRGAESERLGRAAMTGRTRVKRAAVRRVGSGLLAVVAGMRPGRGAAAERQPRPV
jgi:hypothetical protein